MDNIYQRPLFRQMGGPTTAPSPMPAAQAVSTDVTSQLKSMEQAASNEMEAVGAQYVDNMVSGLDNAENTEEVINAIRGNDKPIQARYEELAGIVGDQDAQSTPESVLALVQPTMMMTEQGALDTGIGELVQSLTGDIAMETETGAPTAMGQGIGELMMGAAEPVQQYANGGVVQHFQSGGVGNVAPNLQNVTNFQQPFQVPAALQPLMQGFTPMTDFSTSQLQKSFETRVPLYEQLLGDTENRRQQAKAKLSFDIAKAGLALASGVDPTTGQSMTAQPLGAQIARAAQPVAASAQEAGETMAEAGRTAKIAALQAAEAEEVQRREQAGRERLGQQELGSRAFLQQDQQAFQSEQFGLDRTLQRDLAESAEQHETKLTQMNNDARENLTRLQGEIETDLANLNNEAREALRILIGQQDLDSIDAQGKISMALQKLTGEQRLELQGVVDAGLLQRLERQGELDREIFELDTARRINELEIDFENQMEKLGVIQAHDMDKFSQQLDLEEERMDRQLGGEGKFFGFAPLGFFRSTTAAELAEDNQKFAQDFQRRQSYLNDQYETADIAYKSALLDLERRGVTDRREIELETLRVRETIAALENLQKSQFSFGNTQRGILNDLISDTEVLEAYGAGTLNPVMTSYMETAITTLATPVTSYNPLTGQLEKSEPKLPRGLQDALYQRIQSNLPMPFSNVSFAKGGEAQKMQMGGDPRTDPTAVLEAFGLGSQQRPIQEEDIELPGRIVEPGLDLTKGTGLLRGPREFARSGTSYLKEVTGSGFEPIFGETAEAATQLTTLGNVTQRFIRESVGGRALKDEIQALAQELAKPQGIETRERTYEKLVNMRNQLMEIQDFAMSMVDTPEKFRQTDLVQARKDLRLLQPLLENYDVAITSFEQQLGSDKPDPSLFEGR